MVDVDPMGLCRLAGLCGRAARQTDRGHGSDARHEVAPA
jgi:hypothetical protein